MRPFAFSRADSISEALTLHDAAPGAAYLAGGTTLIDLVKLDVMRPPQVVDLNRIGHDRTETLAEGGLKIGALVRNSDLARDPRVRANYPVVAEALLTGASAQLRNRATTGGNLLQRTRCPYFRDNISPCNKREPGRGCAAIDGYHRNHAILGGSDACIATHPSDLCVSLAVLEAKVLVLGPDGERSIPFSEFHLLPGETPWQETALRRGEIIHAVTLPPPQKNARSWYLKLRDRESFSFAVASAAVWIVPEADGKTLREVRIALGGVATKPWRAWEAEERLKGAPLDPATFRAAAEVALRDAYPREHNAFKVELAKRVIVRALTLVAEGQPPVRTT